jgi:hypothetical protein
MGKKYIKGGNIYKEVGEYFLHYQHFNAEKFVNHYYHYV